MDLKEITRSHPELEFYYISVPSLAYKCHIKGKAVYINEFNIDTACVEQLIKQNKKKLSLA